MVGRDVKGVVTNPEERSAPNNLVFDWGQSEDGDYFTFYGASTLVVYVAIFPVLQYVYNFFTQRATASITATESSTHIPASEDRSRTSDEPSIRTEVHGIDNFPAVPGVGVELVQLIDSGVDTSIKKDLAIFVFGGLLYTVGYAVVPIFEAGNILYIGFTSLMTAYIPSHQTGKALGGICILDTLLKATAALLYGLIFGHTSSTVPSAVYIVSTGMWMLSLAVTVVILSEYRRRWAQL
ncbi:hypothetical protein EC991_002277 [Linnemannia zychae]|nr:hypothetical protein EC991_002277 [Linnemannia zychae]